MRQAAEKEKGWIGGATASKGLLMPATLLELPVRRMFVSGKAAARVTAPVHWPLTKLAVTAGVSGTLPRSPEALSITALLKLARIAPLLSHALTVTLNGTEEVCGEAIGERLKW